mgnify:CR=1 FL=1
MNYKILIIIWTLLFWPISCLTQEKPNVWCGKVTGDNITLPFAHIQLKTESKHFIFTSDRNGMVCLNLEKVQSVDSLIVSYLGYKESKLSIHQVESLREITLEKSIFEIDEVVINAKKEKKFKLGNLWNKSFSSAHIGSGKAALYIPNTTGESVKLLKVRVFVKNLFNYKWKQRPFKLQLYDGESIKEEKLLVNEIITAFNPKNSNWVEIDLSDFHLSLPEKGIFISIQALTNDEYKKLGLIESDYVKIGDEKISNSIVIGLTKRNKAKYPIESWHYYGSRTGWRRIDRGYYMIQLVVSN